jgi:hypothetical protein
VKGGQLWCGKIMGTTKIYSIQKNGKLKAILESSQDWHHHQDLKDAGVVLSTTPTTHLLGLCRKQMELGE